mmetsp:Transcript_18970/g.34245  ORF Transcript_18970/g.34245 Transcript_18970/m.34245 type:complete len:154 (-) Transcript_18970:119-580(-)
MASHIGQLRSFEFKDVTKGGADVAGCTLAVGIGALAGCIAGTLGADKVGAATKEARKLVGGAAGALVGGLVTSGCSNCGEPRLALIAAVLGACLGTHGASLLAPPGSGGAGGFDRRPGGHAGGGDKEPRAEKAEKPKAEKSEKAEAEKEKGDS